MLFSSANVSTSAQHTAVLGFRLRGRVIRFFHALSSPLCTICARAASYVGRSL
uniref:Uncharacterized protein n=1 Tax=Anopheles atroparvus TaxID=41427 RepID=A0AAG5CXK5_ANOAO